MAHDAWRGNEEDMSPSLSLLKATLESTADGILVVDRAGKIVSHNQRFVELWRIPDPIMESREGDQVLAYVREQVSDAEAFLGMVRSLSRQEDAESEDVVELRDGRVFERYSRPQRVKGEPVGRVWSFRDVTTRAHAEEAVRRAKAELEARVRERTEALRESEDRFRTLADGAFEGIVVYDDGPVLLTNRIAEVMFGYAPGEMVGRRISDFLPVELPDGAAAPGDAEPREYVGTRRDGSTFAVELILRSSQYMGRAVKIGAVRDLTNHKQALDALRRSYAGFRTFVERCPDAVFVRRGEALIYVNQALLSLLGYERDELLGRDPVAAFAHSEDRERLLQRRQAFPNGTPMSHDRWVRKDGETITVEAVGVNVDFDGEPARVVLARDVTERNRMQAKLLLSDRLVSVGTLAAGVAHEINNPLAYVIANLDLIGEELRELAADRHAAAKARTISEMVVEARQGAERVRKIVRGLRAFSRADDEHRSVLDVQDVLETAINLTFNEIRHRARLVKDYHPTPPVEADEGRLGQVFVNLLVNAAQAVPEGQVARNEIRLVTGTDSLGRAFVEVSDTGQGIPANVLGRIFDPFFTTKPVGLGTGLGLSICHNIVTGLGGEIAVESTIDRGTTFRVVLPAARDSVDAPKAAPASVHPPATGGRVLVIDDDPLVGVAIRRILKDHAVTVVKSGKAGLEMLLGQGSLFHTILCDLMMPDMSGMELHAEVSRTAPQLLARIVFITGGAFTPAATAFLDSVPNQRLEKPFDTRNLRALVESMVQRSEPRVP
jgi:PAS domain S-box-containing protein